jgi:hypothetical protein
MYDFILQYHPIAMTSALNFIHALSLNSPTKKVMLIRHDMVALPSYDLIIVSLLIFLFFSEVKNHPDIVSLCLQDGPLSNLPIDLIHVTSLEELTLSNNKFMFFPDPFV